MKAFIDTAPFIYLIEKNTEYYDKLSKYFKLLYINEVEVITSVITYSEFGVWPEIKGKQELILNFSDFLNKPNIPLLNITKLHAKKAYQLRAKYRFLKGMDALQLGSAITEGCDKFITNYFKVKKVNEIEVVLVNEIVVS